MAEVELGTITHGPGHVWYFCLNLNQGDDYTTIVDGNDKLSAIRSTPISRLRRRELEASLSSVEAKSFSFLNFTVGWIRVTFLPFCATSASLNQQAAPFACVRDFIIQAADLRVIKALGSSISFHRPTGNECHQLSITFFADAGRSATNGQLCYIAVLLIGCLPLESIYHVVSWSIHKSKRPVRSIGAAEILAAGEAIYEGKILAFALSLVLGVCIALHLIVESKDLFTSTSTKRNSIYKSIRGDVNCIRYELERYNVARVI